MTFLAPTIFFAWLALAVLPLVIYWLYRHRQSLVTWSANYILRKTLREEGKRGIWRQIVILSLRTLVLALLVLALARPLMPRDLESGELPHGDGALHQIVLVDNSRSMSIPYESVTREAEMLSRLQALLKRMRHGDRCEVIPLTVGENQNLAPIEVPCPASVADIRALIDRIQLLERPAAVLDGLQLAAERFHVTSSQNRHLVLLSDLSRKDFPENRYLLNLKPVFEQQNTRLALYEIRDGDQPNLAIERMENGAGTFYAGWTYHVYPVIRNYSLRPVESSIAVEVEQNGRIIRKNRLSLDMKAMEKKVFDLPFTAPETTGLVKLRVRVTDASYAHDNVRELTINIKPQVRILLVYDDSEDSVHRPLWRESYFFEAALDTLTRPAAADSGPAKSGQSLILDTKTGERRWQSDSERSQTQDLGKRPAVKLTKSRVRASELQVTDIADADAVVFLGVTHLDPDVRDALLRFVQHGGGVLLGMSETVFADEFNESFSPLYPAPLQKRYLGIRRERNDWDYDAAHKRVEKVFTAPLLRRYLTEAEGPIENVRVYNYFQLEPVEAPLMILSNGDPLLVEKQLGRGKVLLFTSSLGGTWNTLPARNMYPNFVFAWLTYLSSFSEYKRTLDPGEPFFLEASDEDVHVAPPHGRETVGPLRAMRVDGKQMYRFDQTESPGEYAVYSGKRNITHFYVNDEYVESNTLGLEPAERENVTKNLGSVIVNDWRQMADALASPEHRGIKLTGLFALLMMAALLLDAALTRMWFR